MAPDLILRDPDAWPAFWGVWTGDKERRIDWAVVARRWQRTDTGDVAKPDDS